MVVVTPPAKLKRMLVISKVIREVTYSGTRGNSKPQKSLCALIFITLQSLTYRSRFPAPSTIIPSVRFARAAEKVTFLPVTKRITLAILVITWLVLVVGVGAAFLSARDSMLA